jgi:hypothetical protein
MTTQRDPDTEPTVEIERPNLPAPVAELEDVDQNFDPEKTLVRDDWESTAIRRVAPHVAAVQDEMASNDDEPFGWESEAVRRLSRVVQNHQL